MTRVLVVEDEVAISVVLAIALQDEGHEVATAHNGIVALEEARRQPPGGGPAYNGARGARSRRCTRRGPG